jgi:ABC-2 type transport system permease protein
MKAYWQIVRAQLLLFLRNKNTFIWSFFLPVFMMIALGTLVGNGGNQFSLTIAIADEDRTAISQQFAGQLKQLKGIETSFASREQGIRQLKKGEVDLVVVLQKGLSEQFQKKGKEMAKPLVTLYYDQSNLTTAQIGSSLIRQLVDQLNKQHLGFIPKVTVAEKNIQTNPLTYIDFLVPGILSLMIMSNNLNGVAATIASWRERGILRRMQGTPLKSSTFIAGQMTARILFNAMQVVIVVLIAYFLFDVKVYGSWWALLFLILLGTLTFMSIGFIVASLSKTPESASPIAGLISFPMIFVGGIFFPIRSLPGFLQGIVQAIPIGHLTDALRGVMNEGTSLWGLQTHVWILLAWAIGAFVIASVTFRWDVK